VHASLTQAEHHAMIREKIRDELPTLLKLYRADKFLVNKIVASASAFFEEVRNDPSHPFRGEFDRMCCRSSTASHRSKLCRSIDGLKRDLLARPELTDLARHIWANARSLFERSRLRRDPGVAAASGGMFMAAARRWPATPNARRINQGLVAVLRTVVAEQKSGVSTFISDQVKSWTWGNYLADRNQYRPRTCNTSASTLADRRACRTGAVHARIPAAAAVTNQSRRAF